MIRKIFASCAFTIMASFASNITKDCMLTTDEFGDVDRSEEVEFVSNMMEIVGVGEKIMFMRTVDLYVCSRVQRIHGIRISLRHDPDKDPDHNENYDNFMSHSIAPSHESTFFTTMLGLQDGECEYIYVSEEERIEAIVVHHDNKLIRVIEFKMSTGRI